MTRLAAPVAVLAAGWSLAAWTRGESAETTYLTLLATGVLTAVAWLTPRPTMDLGIGAVLAVLLLWILPPGPTRGAAMTFLLLALAATAATRRWAPLLSPRSKPKAPSWIALATAIVPTVLALEGLMGARGLIGAGPDLATAARFFIVPGIAAGSVVVLARIHGLLSALIAGAAAMTLGGGASPCTAWALAALAGGSVLGAPVRVVPSARRGSALAVRALAGLAVLAPVLWQQRAGAIAAAGGLALAAAMLQGPALRTLRVGLTLLPALAVLAIAVWAPLHPWGEAVSGGLWLSVAVPALLLALRKQPALALGAAALALAAGRATADLTALVAPAALAAIALADFTRDKTSRLSSTALALQGLWSAVLLATTVLATTYPWLRAETPALAALTTVDAPVAPSTVAHFGGRVLDVDNPDLELDLSGETIRKVVLDTHLAHADGVAAGTRVAVLQLEDSTGRSMEWPLHAGTHTGEWAAARSDLVQREDLATPVPWISQVVADEDGAWFFARRYRTVLDLEGLPAPDRLILRRDPALAPQVTVAVFHVAVFHVEARP